MTAELSSTRMRKRGGIMIHLSSAASEWLLIFLLFVDAVFSYFIREFANYCELQTPCPLCSRLDHVFGGCSWNLLCSSHKEEISSLLFCSLHGKLAGLCEECFKSIAIKDSEYKLLVDKLWMDVERSFNHNCSCCKKAWLGAKSDDESLFELKPVGLGGYNSNAESPLPRRDGRKRLTDKIAASVRKRPTGTGSVEDTDFKLSSDSDGGEKNSSYVDVNHTILERGVAFGKGDHLAMPVNNVMKDESGILDLNELKNVNDSLSASPSVRITKKSIYIEETGIIVDRSATMYAEATAGTSSDDSSSSSGSSTCSSTSYSQHMKLDAKDSKFMLQASQSEVGLLLNDPIANKKESLDRFHVSDVESERIIDELRQQVENDERCMKSLYEELEEERKAADIAANQALAMITRLQEEKAAAEMEALQYMRMMELQAEHDMESLERELLFEKEKELQELQSELELYKNNFCYGSVLMDDDCENSQATPGDFESAKFLTENGKASHSLKKLVKNLNKDYCSENIDDAPNRIRCVEKSGSCASDDSSAEDYHLHRHENQE